MKVSKDSKLEGLPEKYSPCVVDWKKNSIVVSGARITIPDIFEDVLQSKRSYTNKNLIFLEPGIRWRIEFSASWFHEKQSEEALPDYLLLKLYPEKKDYFFIVFIDLEEKKIVGTEIVLTTFSKDSGDVWVNFDKPISDSTVNYKMQLVLKPSDQSVWDKYKKK